MYRHLFSVGGLTLLSRVTGFLRDIVLGYVLGAGAGADAFVVAQRLPNHFRAIFGEGAFNSAYVPSYARVLERSGQAEASTFASQIFTILLASQVLLLGLAMAFMPQFVALLAPGFAADPAKMDLAVTMTRITFPYLLCVTLVTLHSGTLNAHRRFVASAFAPVLLNVVMVAFLCIAFIFPSAGIAASAGITASGVLQLALLMVAARRAGVLEGLVRPAWTQDVRRFFAALGPAVIGSAGVQIAIFADTIIGSLLPTGGPSSIYYAERIYQLPIGVIGIAAGTVLLPEMSRHFAAGRPEEALRAQNRTMAITLALTTPFFLAFILVPQEIMRGIFLRGRFGADAVAASADVLWAYGFGLLPIVLIRSAVSGFQARGNNTVPMAASLIAVACNLGLKILLYKRFGAVGLATATAVGAWVNLLLLSGMGLLQGVFGPDNALARMAIAVDFAAVALIAFLLLIGPGLAGLTEGHRFANEMLLLGLGGGGGIVYGGILLFTLWLFRATMRSLPAAEDPA